ncbi:two-component system, LuxR family, response regulator DctR [Andreprevotia lacus DSM 23236]|jgi:two-component system response regulator DctR|uniref:Two-component system, LuxR family, response regulator DctR n=1 Tax=Andreprevotia lacus DSM 23236 TaxID=1121001 RepID=A0A1W1XSH4_9NEIS|nr:response regulator [Andreprevotia lacus]SMC26846.1 two-component system, LuxR family, response regulator DctR [Andreprevotia lacus DSM 23236]
MPSNPNRIAIVDDDDALRDALAWLFSTRDHEVQSFASADAFLKDYSPDRFGCILLDVRMPGMSGLELFQKLKEYTYLPPVIFLTGHGDVPMAVGALKDGATDFVEKPFNDNDIVDLVEKSLVADQEHRSQWQAKNAVEIRLESLTPREREVMTLILTGRLNKQIADDLSISMKTVEVHRARILEKMHVKTAMELAALLRDAGVET